MVDDPEAYQTTQPGGTATPTQDTIVPEAYRGPAPVVLPPAGYAYGEVIGRGGMGEVIAAHDLRIGRDVAIKRMRDGRTDQAAVSRFLREARIQARLDHPAIVPVHELGTDAEGRPYFTMKRLAGETLAQRLAVGGRLQPLLRAFIDVCLAVELAHTRGVVHRDLKPANIIIGDFGEVYVLDWGIARVLDEGDAAPTQEAHDTLDEGTQAGSILGTPGYMAPEQIRGEAVTGATDVYALGSILFEILAATPLHPRGPAAIAMTLAQPQDSPAQRKPELAVAPELDAACMSALAADPAARPRARALADAIQSYLDGDRDQERRRALAEVRLAEARTTDDHGRAIYLAGQAVTLAPDHAAASELLLELFLRPPAIDPPELVASIDKSHRELTRIRARNGVKTYASVFLFLVFIPFMHVISWAWLVAFYVALGGMIAVTAVWARRGVTSMPIAAVGTVVLAVTWSRIAGPFMLTPVLICGALLTYTTHPWMSTGPWRTVGFAATAVMVPIVLELTGVLGSTFGVVDGIAVTRSAIYEIRGTLELVGLIAANLGFVLAVGMFALSINRAARLGRESLQRQTWALGQLLPRAARPHET